jgi:DivIVA domain-containing protein
VLLPSNVGPTQYRSATAKRGTIGAVMWFWVVVLVLLLGAVAVVAAGRDNSMAEAYDDRPDRTIPTGRPLTAGDLQEVRFSSALRGYRMDEVDALLDRIAADLLSREQYERPGSAEEPEPGGHSQHGQHEHHGQHEQPGESPSAGAHRPPEAGDAVEQDSAHATPSDDAPRDANR